MPTEQTQLVFRDNESIILHRKSPLRTIFAVLMVSGDIHGWWGDMEEDP